MARIAIIQRATGFVQNVMVIEPEDLASFQASLSSDLEAHAAPDNISKGDMQVNGAFMDTRLPQKTTVTVSEEKQRCIELIEASWAKAANRLSMTATEKADFRAQCVAALQAVQAASSMEDLHTVLDFLDQHPEFDSRRRRG